MAAWQCLRRQPASRVLEKSRASDTLCLLGLSVYWARQLYGGQSHFRWLVVALHFFLINCIKTSLFCQYRESLTPGPRLLAAATRRSAWTAERVCSV